MTLPPRTGNPRLEATGDVAIPEIFQFVFSSKVFTFGTSLSVSSTKSVVCSMNPQALRSEVSSLINELWLLKGHSNNGVGEWQKQQMLFLVEHAFDEAYLHYLLLSLQRQKFELLNQGEA